MIEWLPVVETAVTALAMVATVAVGVVVPLARKYLKARAGVAGVLLDKMLGEKMDEGAINIIKAAETRLRLSVREGMGTPTAPHVSDEKIVISPEQILQEAQPVLEREFRETIEHFGKTPDAVRNYLEARLERATRS